MKLALVLLTAMLIGTISAEPIKFGNYTATFAMTQTHIIGDEKIKTFDGWVAIHEYKSLYTDTSVPISEINVSGNPATLGFFKDRSGYQAVLNNYPIIVISTMNLTSTMDFLKSLKITKNKV
jgi:hypothetical protein